jgi:hypothetical protein
MEIAYPNNRNVELIDWVDYTQRLDAITPQDAARTVLAFVPSTANIFALTSAGYITHEQRCDQFVAALADLGRRTTVLILASDAEVFEHTNVIQLAPKSGR